MKTILLLVIGYLVVTNYTNEQIGSAVFETGSTLQEIGEDITTSPVTLPIKAKQ